MSYFQTKVSFLGELENGTVKKITKQYLVDAMSFTETEARVIKQLGNTEELYFDSIAHSPIQEVVYPSDMTMILWFKCKVVYKDIDEATEKEKKTTIYLLVGACDVNEAYERCKDHLKEMLVPFEIPKVEETAICEIYQYEKPVPAGYTKWENVSIPSGALKLTAELLERRDQVKRLFGDKYDEKVMSWIPVIEAGMKHHGADNPFSAVIEMTKEKHVDEVAGSLMIATAVEMVEGNFEYEAG